MMDRGAVVVPALVLALGTPAALADDGRDLFDRGRERYQAGDYVAAAELFLEAHAREGRPELLFNAAQAFRRAKVCDRAAMLYRDFLIAAPRSPNRRVIEQHIAEMDRCLAHRRGAPGRDEPPGAHSWRATAGWASTGTGAALLAVAGLLAVDAKRASDHVPKTEDERRWTPKDVALASRASRSKRLAWTTGAVGAGALAAGVFLLVSGDRESTSSPRIAVVERGAVAGWSWRF